MRNEHDFTLLRCGFHAVSLVACMVVAACSAWRPSCKPAGRRDSPQTTPSRITIERDVHPFGFALTDSWDISRGLMPSFHSALAFSASGLLALAEADRLRVVSAPTWRELWQVRDTSSGPVCAVVAMANRGDRLACSTPSNRLRVYETTGGALIADSPLPTCAAMLYSHDDTMIVTGGNGVQIVETSTNRVTRSFDGSSITALALTHNDKLLAVGDDDGVISLWNLDANARAWRTATLHAGISGLAFIDGDKSLAAVARMNRAWLRPYKTRPDTAFASVRNVADGGVTFESQWPQRDVHVQVPTMVMPVLGLDGTVLNASQDGGLLIHAVLRPSGQDRVNAIAVSDLEDPLAVSGDGHWAIAGCVSGCLARVIDLQRGTIVHTLGVRPARITSFARSVDGSLFALYDESGKLWMVDLGAGRVRVLSEIPPRGRADALAFEIAANGAWLVASTNEGLDVIGTRSATRYQIPEASSVFALSPSGARVAVVVGGRVQVRDTATGEVTVSGESKRGSPRVMSLAFLDEYSVVSEREGGTAQILPDGPHDSHAYQANGNAPVSLVVAGRHLVGLSSSGEILIWSTASGRHEHTLALPASPRRVMLPTSERSVTLIDDAHVIHLDVASGTLYEADRVDDAWNNQLAFVFGVGKAQSTALAQTMRVGELMLRVSTSRLEMATPHATASLFGVPATGHALIVANDGAYDWLGTETPSPEDKDEFRCRVGEHWRAMDTCAHHRRRGLLKALFGPENASRPVPGLGTTHLERTGR